MSTTNPDAYRLFGTTAISMFLPFTHSRDMHIFKCCDPEPTRYLILNGSNLCVSRWRKSVLCENRIQNNISDFPANGQLTYLFTRQTDNRLHQFELNQKCLSIEMQNSQRSALIFIFKLTRPLVSRILNESMDEKRLRCGQSSITDHNRAHIELPKLTSRFSQLASTLYFVWKIYIFREYIWKCIGYMFISINWRFWDLLEFHVIPTKRTLLKPYCWSAAGNFFLIRLT